MTDPQRPLAGPAEPVGPARPAGRADRPDSVCYVHIGTMKSGTTFLQQMMSHHWVAMAEDGALFPGRGSYVRQINGVRDVLDLPGVVPRERLEGSWAELVHEVHSWPGPTSVISVEYLSIAPPQRVRAVVESLAPTFVDVVLTVRDLARVLPSTWQENIQNGLTWTWPDFMASVRAHPGADPRAGARFWRQHDFVQTATRWAEVVGVDHVHVVTLPPSGAPRDLLWRRFCEVLGLDAQRYPVEGTTLRSNPGLGRASAEMLRRVNALLDGRVDRAARLKILKRGLAKAVLADSDDDLPIVLDDEQYAWAQHVARDQVEQLAQTGIHIVGDFDELVPPDRPEATPLHLREPTESEIAAAAAEAVAALLTQFQPTIARSRRAGDATRRRRSRTPDAPGTQGGPT